MPTYSYHCRVCSNDFEVEQKMTDKAWAECPKCRVGCSNRLVSSGTSFSLKGDGWAKDGYGGTKT